MIEISLLHIVNTSQDKAESIWLQSSIDTLHL